jgi:hypothetical protein
VSPILCGDAATPIHHHDLGRISRTLRPDNNPAAFRRLFGTRINGVKQKIEHNLLHLDGVPVHLQGLARQKQLELGTSFVRLALQKLRGIADDAREVPARARPDFPPHRTAHPQDHVVGPLGIDQDGGNAFASITEPGGRVLQEVLGRPGVVYYRRKRRVDLMGKGPSELAKNSHAVHVRRRGLTPAHIDLRFMSPRALDHDH